MNWIRRLPQAPLTTALLGVNVAVFIAMVLLGHHVWQFDNRTLILSGANVVLGGSAQSVVFSHWRWLTAAFVHVNLIHIAMNMAFLVQLGVLSERFVGGGLLTAGYVVTGVLGNVLSTVWATSHGTPLLAAGASGGIMGLSGMIAVLAWMADQKPIAKALMRNAAFIIVLGVAISFSGRGLFDNGAHIGGFVSGAAIGGLRTLVRRPLARRYDILLAVAAFLATAAAFAVIVREGFAITTVN
jgi:rhomboid protease GluP